MTVPARTDPRAAPPLADEPPPAPGRRRPGLAGRVLPPLVFSLVVLGAWQAYTGLADLFAEFRVTAFTEFERTAAGAWAVAREYPLTGSGH